MKIKHINICLFIITCFSLAACSSEDEFQTITEKKHLEFFQQKPNAIEFFNKVIEEFEAEHPDIDVEQVNVPGDMSVVLKTRIARGDVPDIFITYPIEQDYIIRAKKGYLLDLTNEEFISNIDSKIQNRYLVDGKMYGAALSQNAVGVFYNKDKFEELKLEIPKTWDEFIETLKKLEEIGEQPILMANKELESISVFNLSLVANEFDNRYWKSLQDTQKDFEGDQTWKNVSNKMLQVIDFSQENSFRTDADDLNRAFINREGVMCILGIWEIANLEKLDPSFSYGIFPFPATNDPDRNNVLGGVDGGFAISADTKYPDEAKQFLEFLFKKENAQKFSDYEGNISTVKDIKMNIAEVKILADHIDQGKSVNWPNHYWLGGTAAEDDFREISQKFFFERDINAYLKNLEKMFDRYRIMQKS
jgi:raffinose/stachyose/melibiose transport system substrate-binding protein